MSQDPRSFPPQPPQYGAPLPPGAQMPYGAPMPPQAPGPLAPNPLAYAPPAYTGRPAGVVVLSIIGILLALWGIVFTGSSVFNVLSRGLMPLVAMLPMLINLGLAVLLLASSV